MGSIPISIMLSILCNVTTNESRFMFLQIQRKNNIFQFSIIYFTHIVFIGYRHGFAMNPWAFAMSRANYALLKKNYK